MAGLILLLGFFHNHFLSRGVLLVSREVPVKHLNCQYLKHIGESDGCVIPAVSAVFKTHTNSGDIMTFLWCRIWSRGHHGTERWTGFSEHGMS